MTAEHRRAQQESDVLSAIAAINAESARVKRRRHQKQFGQISLKAIAGRAGYSEGTTAAVVWRLIYRGIVTRIHLGNDRGIRYIVNQGAINERHAA